jgi:membrane-associated phospholipid phosphatase
VARSLALFISYLFMPLLMPTMVFVFLLFGVPQVAYLNNYNKVLILAMVFVTTFLVPLISLLTMKLTKHIGSLHLDSREDRVFPFSTISLFYILSTYLFYLKLEVEPIFILTLAAVSICVTLLASITFFWKISAHMTGMAGLTAIVMVFAVKYPTVDLLPFVLVSVVASGAVGSARLRLNAHRPIEILGGFALGFLICFLSFFLFL